MIFLASQDFLSYNEKRATRYLTSLLTTISVSSFMPEFNSEGFWFASEIS